MRRSLMLAATLLLVGVADQRCGRRNGGGESMVVSCELVCGIATLYVHLTLASGPQVLAYTKTMTDSLLPCLGDSGDREPERSSALQ
mmetsp:Transcript_9971/g.27894  ORF Transcript_9971/g.27894 Transcript_9971/m.27894 type:complete len:87 (+) Transcript_9971:656-916(+)